MNGLLIGTEDGLWHDGQRVAEGRIVEVVATPAGGWVALVDGTALRHSDDRAGTDLPGPPATCALALDGTIVVGTAEAHLLRVEDGTAERVRSFDEAEGRDRWYTPWGGPPDTRYLAAADDGTLYVNVHVGGIVRSDDGGSSWAPTIDVDSDVHQVVVSGDRVVAATAYGMAQSLDRGATWSFVTAGLDANYSRAVAVAGDWLLLTSSTGPRTTRAAVYRRPLDAAEGVPFERCRDGLPDWFTQNVDTRSLVAAPDGRSIALAGPDGTVFLSADAGATWEVAPAASPGGPVTCLAFV